MKKIIFVINILIILVLCFGCSESTYTDDSTPTSENKLSQQELQALHEDDVKKFIIESSVKFFSYNGYNNYLFSGLSFYSEIQMIKLLSSSEMNSVFNDIIQKDFSNLRDKLIYNQMDKQFNRNKLILSNDRYEREQTGFLAIDNTLSVNNEIDNYKLSTIIDYYNANIYLNSSTDNNQFFISNQIIISNVWNDYKGSISLSEKVFEFKNSDGTVVKRNFLNAGNIGSKYDFGSFTGFMIKTEDDFNIYFILPNEGKSLSEVFTVNNICELINHNYINNPTDYTKCFFPEYEINSSIDINNFLSETYKFNDLNTTINQDNHLKVDRFGINSKEISVSPEDLVYTGIKYYYLEDFIIDRPFGFIISYNDFQLFSGVVANI